MWFCLSTADFLQSSDETRKTTKKKGIVTLNNNYRRGREQQDGNGMEQMNIGDIEIIDFCTPVNQVAPLPPPSPLVETGAAALSVSVATNGFAQLSLTPAIAATSMHLTSYQPRTLVSNSGRLLILPAFPTAITNNHCLDLLLANVPGKSC